MDRTSLLDALAVSLKELYDMEVFAPMSEFYQGELRVLEYLHLYEQGKVYPSDISDSLHVTRQRVTSILSSLRKKGFINMEIAVDDRRKMCVILTESGKNHIIAKEAGIEKYFNIWIDGLGKNNIRELTRLINLTIDQFKK